MDYKSYYTDPRHMAYMEIMAARHKSRKAQHSVTPWQCEKQFEDHRKAVRRNVYGTDVSLEPFLRDLRDKSRSVVPDIEGVHLLVSLLTPLMENCFYPYRYDWIQEELGLFIETVLIMLSRQDYPGDCIFDSILTLAECYEKDPEVYFIVYQGFSKDFTGEMANYYSEMYDYLEDFLAVHGDAGRPPDFSQKIAFALGKFLGKFYAA